jgi:hypothetical protein
MKPKELRLFNDEEGDTFLIADDTFTNKVKVYINDIHRYNLFIDKKTDTAILKEE